MIESIKTDIKSAIEAKGVSMSGVSFPDYPSVIASIQTGITMEDYIGNKVSVLTGSATSVPNNRFAQVFYLKSVDLPECIEIGNSAFASCLQLESVHLSECTTIGNRGFYYCTSLSDVNIPECTTLGSYAFVSCINLSYVNLPNIVYLGASYDSSSSVVSHPGNYAFQDCWNLTTVNIPNCECISSGVFQRCSALSFISLPKCKYLGVNAFTGQSDLSVYLMGSVVPTIPSSAVFNGITGTLSIYVPESLYSLYQASSYWWNRYSSNIVSVSEPDLAFDSSTGLLYGTASRIYWEFESSLGISLTDVLAVSLSQCTSVGAAAFRGCTNLSTVTLDSCDYIGDGAFTSTGLQTLHLGGSNVCQVDSLGPNINSNTFVSLYVPSSLVTSYETASYWSNFSSKIVPIQ